MPRWWTDIDALQQASAMLLDRLPAELHRPTAITLVSNFAESAQHWASRLTALGA